MKTVKTFFQSLLIYIAVMTMGVVFGTTVAFGELVNIHAYINVTAMATVLGWPAIILAALLRTLEKK